MTQTRDPRAAAAALPLDKRIERYERVMSLRGLDPETGARIDGSEQMSYEAIGETFDPPIVREAVRQIIERGRPRAVGRPPKPK